MTAGAVTAGAVTIGEGLLETFEGVRRAAAPLSAMADPVGWHSDPLHPSQIERAVGAWLSFPREAQPRAEALMRVLRAAPRVKAPPELPLSDLVLVVVDAPAVGPDDLEAMTAAAQAENPDAEVVAFASPCAPDAAARMARSKLPAPPPGETFMELAARAVRVYVADSLRGLEALIAGAPVTCFGAPVYAGWGLTDDRGPRLARRSARPPLWALVWAAYFETCRYKSPFDGAACGAMVAAGYLARLRRWEKRLSGEVTFAGLAPWKWPNLRPFFATSASRAKLRWLWGGALARQRRLGGTIAYWASRAPQPFVDECARRNVAVVHVEDGFIRSVGLGSNLVRGHSIVIDRRGIYYDPRTPSDLEHMLETEPATPEELAEARRLRAALVEQGVTKYNVGGDFRPQIDIPRTRRRILVPGQVENDASVRTGSPLTPDNLSLLRAVREAAPDAYIFYKPHPDVEAGNRPGAIPAAIAEEYADEIILHAGINAVFRFVDELHTMTSLSGFEALLRGLRVATYGGPFYAGWGLTQDRMPLPRRTRRITLDELIAVALVRYPRYVYPGTGTPCGPLDLVAALSFGEPQTQFDDRLFIKRAARFVRGLFM